MSYAYVILGMQDASLNADDEDDGEDEEDASFRRAPAGRRVGGSHFDTSRSLTVCIS